MQLWLDCGGGEKSVLVKESVATVVAEKSVSAVVVTAMLKEWMAVA